MGIRRQLVVMGMLCGVLVHGVAQSSPAADWSYTALLQQLVGKTVSATLAPAPDGLFRYAVNARSMAQ